MGIVFAALPALRWLDDVVTASSMAGMAPIVAADLAAMLLHQQARPTGGTHARTAGRPKWHRAGWARTGTGGTTCRH
jgi:hypothetical protein